MTNRGQTLCFIKWPSEGSGHMRGSIMALNDFVVSRLSRSRRGTKWEIFCFLERRRPPLYAHTDQQRAPPPTGSVALGAKRKWKHLYRLPDNHGLVCRLGGNYKLRMSPTILDPILERNCGRIWCSNASGLRGAVSFVASDGERPREKNVVC